MALDRILVIGARGQLGSALLRQEWPVGTFVLPATRDQLDVTDPAAVWSYLLRWRPQVVVNAARHPDPAAAEADPAAATAVDHDGVEAIVQGVAAIGARLVHLSTAEVFDGSKDGWYREADEPNPLGAAARAKLAGERAALRLPDSLVIRSSWLYSSTGDNVVTAVVDRSRVADRIEAVADRRGCPTSADDLARAIVVAVRRGLHQCGLFHVAAPDDASPYDVADETLRLIGRRDQVDLVATRTERRAELGGGGPPSPPHCRLSSDAFAAAYDHVLPPWRESLRAVVAELDRREQVPVS